MLIGGLQKMTLIDYPGKIAATVFLVGCNFRCPYCHNPELVNPSTSSGQALIKESDFFKFLDERMKFLDGVCITGGEPTIHSDLLMFIQKIKKRGFSIKLDTNGSNPGILEYLIKNDLVDFVAMDIKTSILKYNKVHPVKSRKAGAAEQLFNGVKKSINIIKNSNKDYEFRTTVVPRIIDEEDIKEIAQWLKGAKKIALQQFRPASPAGGPGKLLDSSFETLEPYPIQDLQKMLKILEPHIQEVELRV